MDTAPVIPILYDMEKNRSSLPEDKIPDLYKAAAAENIAEDIRTDVSISKKKFPAGDETADPNDLYSYSDTAKRISKKTKNDNDDRRVREILDSEKQQKELISRVFSRFRAEFETEETETLGQWTPKIRGIMDANQYTPFQFTAFDGLDSYKEYRRTLLNVTEFPSLVNFDMFISLLIMHPRFIPAKLQTPNPINI
ncbi:hypothetical protein CHS0354_006837 [Potamilus streckersoni]|uniref:Uncharacterized protein n=1 Tax=Potamilus streckersoni TaxID=2493646 RepID=A0AAE0TEB6_9BIVA|nr:hypothetical protein CHS0354_006837 [Potamilus streckersoni]